MKVKYLTGCIVLTDFQKKLGIITIEDKINLFLEVNPEIDILHIKQSGSVDGDAEGFGTTVDVSIWYKEPQNR